MSPDSSTVIVRQTFLDRANETPASLNIECVNGAEKPAPLSAAQLQRGLLAAAQFVQGVAHTFAQWAELFRQRPNTLETTDQTMFAAAGGDPNIYYLHGYWDVPVDHALVIDTPVPECDLWNFQLNNYWMESLDYRFLPISVNKHTAKYNADGSVTIVVAATDPGVGNFIDTAGHTCGTMLLRWTGATSHPVPTCRLVKLDELRALRG